MIKIIIPQEDANSDSGTIVSITSPNLSFVKKNDVLFEVETSKAVFDILAESDGYVVYDFELNKEVTFNNVVGYIVESESEAKELNDKINKIKTEGDLTKLRLTAKAKRIIEEHSLDLSKISKKGIITEKDLYPLMNKQIEYSFLDIDKYPPNIKKVLIICGGYGSQQVIDILRDYNDIKIVGILDDTVSKKGKKILGFKIIGYINDLENLYKKRFFSHSIVAISTDVEFRKSLFEKCISLGIPMINAIDKSCVIRSNVTIGKGNVICGNTYIGSFSQLGDNNFISASTSIDHHNIWHSHISTGPNCVTSALVEIKDNCRFGMGVFFEPKIVVGENCTIASGAIITSPIPPNTLVRSKIDLRKSTKK